MLTLPGHPKCCVETALIIFTCSIEMLHNERHGLALPEAWLAQMGVGVTRLRADVVVLAAIRASPLLESISDCILNIGVANHAIAV